MKFIILAGMSELKMQATGSKYVNNVYFDTDSGNTIGVNTIWSGSISNIMDDVI